ncbi:MAG: hypothetical protein ACRDSH_21995 [Pseudonocardiaceae bacterium]
MSTPADTRPDQPAGTERQARTAGMCTVVVVSDGFHHAGCSYGWLDELEIPAESLSGWLESGHVRLLSEWMASR